MIMSKKRHKLEAQNMEMILVSYCARNLGMIRTSEVWVAMDSENENFISFLSFIVHSCVVVVVVVTMIIVIIIIIYD